MSGCYDFYAVFKNNVITLAYWNSWTLDARVGHWTVDARLWTLDCGRWTLDAGLWKLKAGLWTRNASLWTLKL